MTLRRRAVLGLALLTAGGVGAALALVADRSGNTNRTVQRTSTAVVFVATGQASVPPAPEPREVTVSILDPAASAPVERLLPPDAALQQVTFPRGPDPMVALVWSRELRRPAGEQQLGLAVWEHRLRRGLSVWSRVFRLRASNASKSSAVEGLQVFAGDVTRDSRDDLLVFEDTGGSAGCGTYVVFRLGSAGGSALYRRGLCLDQGTIRLAHGDVVVVEGVGFAGPGTHCCYRRTRVTTLSWNGRALVRSGTRVRPNRTPGRWPPG